MKYIALFRGINVGKNNWIAMKDLRETFVRLGFGNVSTYINSGNVLFETGDGEKSVSSEQAEVVRMTDAIESVIKKDFGFAVRVLVKKEEEIHTVANTIPKDWQNKAEQKADVAFLFPEADREDIVHELPLMKDYIQLIYIKGALLWSVNRKDYNKSHLNKIISHPLYTHMTIRNVNTVRKLSAICTVSKLQL